MFFSLVLIIVCALLFVFTDQLMALLAPGFAVSQIEITAGLTRIMFLSPVLLGLSGIVSGVLQSYKRFLIYSLAPILYNLGIIVGALFLVPVLGIMAWLGALSWARFYIWWFNCRQFSNWDFIIDLAFHLRDSKNATNFQSDDSATFESWRSIRLIWCRDDFRSMLVIASLAVYNFANNLQSLPLGLIGVAFAIAAFPTLGGRGRAPKSIRNLIAVRRHRQVGSFYDIPVMVFTS